MSTSNQKLFTSVCYVYVESRERRDDFTGKIAWSSNMSSRMAEERLKAPSRAQVNCRR